MVLAGVGLLTACAQLQLTPTPMPTLVATPTLARTPTATPTPTLAPTPTVSGAVEPTVRAQSTASPTPAATRLPPSGAPLEIREDPQPIVGYWEGTELWPGGEAELIVEFFMEGDAVQALRIHGHEGSALTNVSFEPPRVHFEIWVDGEVIVTYDGELEGGTITGEVAEEGESAPFVLVCLGTRGGIGHSSEYLGEPHLYQQDRTQTS